MAVNQYKFNWPYITSLVEKKDYEHPEVLRTIDTMCEVVWLRYFNFPSLNQMDREDMMQEGRLKAIKMLHSGYYDPKYSLKNFFYTGIRNEMQNFIVRSQKNPISGADNFDFDVLPDNASYEGNLVIEEDLLASVFGSFSPEYHPFVHDVARSMQERGFVFNGPLPAPSRLTFRAKEIVSKLECLSIWAKMSSLKEAV